MRNKYFLNKFSEITLPLLNPKAKDSTSGDYPCANAYRQELADDESSDDESF